MKRQLIYLLYGIQELEFENQEPYIEQIKECMIDKCEYYKNKEEPETYEAYNTYFDKLEELKKIVGQFDNIKNKKDFYELSQMILSYQAFYGGLKKYKIEMKV